MLRCLFYFCVFTLTLGQFAALSKSGEMSLYMFDLVAGGFAAVGILVFLLRGTLWVPKVLWAFFAFCFVGVVSLIPNFGKLPVEEFMVAAFYLVRFLIYLVSAVVVVNMVREKFITVRQILLAFVYSGVALSVVGFAQLALLPNFTVLDSELGWDPHKNRLASTFFDPNFLGGYLAMCLGMVGFLWSTAKSSLTKSGGPVVKRNLLIAGVIMLAALTLTFSRSSWAAFGVVVLIFGIFKYRYLLFVGILVAFLAYFAVPRVQTRLVGITDPADSASFRLISWGNALEISKDNLFLGVGFNAFRYAQKDYGFFEVDSLGGHAGAGSDSSLLLVLATTGIVGFAVFVGGFLYILLGIFRRNGKFSVFGRDLDTKVLILTVSGVLVLQSQFINSLFYPQVMFLWIVVLGILAAETKRGHIPPDRI